VRQGFEDKLPAAEELIRSCGLGASQVCYLGDDLTDLPVMRHVGLGAAVADAASEVREAAGWVSQMPGGRGAVRELIETILKAKGRWEELIQGYLR
jgi:YrbI family 3-deoxy-D-manno-octulosonate 8-phosphate phosphatase